MNDPSPANTCRTRDAAVGDACGRSGNNTLLSKSARLSMTAEAGTDAQFGFRVARRNWTESFANLIASADRYLPFAFAKQSAARRNRTSRPPSVEPCPGPGQRTCCRPKRERTAWSLRCHPPDDCLRSDRPETVAERLANCGTTRPKPRRLHGLGPFELKAGVPTVLPDTANQTGL